jgi:hypothetical protein
MEAEAQNLDPYTGVRKTCIHKVLQSAAKHCTVVSMLVRQAAQVLGDVS